MFLVPGAACPAAAAAIDHSKSKGEGAISGGGWAGEGWWGVVGEQAEKDALFFGSVIFKKNELECVSNLSSVEFAALQSLPTINKVFKTHRL